jgi:hypothetical protein
MAPQMEAFDKKMADFDKQMKEPLMSKWKSSDKMKIYEKTLWNTKPDCKKTNSI